MDVGYDVSVKDIKTNTTTMSRFDYVIVCSGKLKRVIYMYKVNSTELHISNYILR